MPEPIPILSVIVCTHNPHPGRLQRVFAGLHTQTLAQDQWEIILVDNASEPPLVAADWRAFAPANFQLIAESKPGLSHARRCGVTAARGGFIVLVDDDNLLAKDYLATVLQLFAAHPVIGALGGRSLPEFETTPPAWTKEFDSLLALRDLSAVPLISHGLRSAGATHNVYPPFSPIGAGMALRRSACSAWLTAHRTGNPIMHDRQGGALTSGGDNDLVLHALRSGWEVGYFPGLALTHLIPASRLEANYLARLNRGIQHSWMQVLSLHDANPWPPLSATGATMRKIKAWFTYQAWRTPSARIRWQGACGHFEGRVKP